MSGLFNGPCPRLLASTAGRVGNYNTSLQREEKKKNQKANHTSLSRQKSKETLAALAEGDGDQGQLGPSPSDT